MANHPYRGLAVALSFLLPGLGQIYNQEFAKGVRFIIAYIISWALSFILIGWVLLLIVWIWSMVDAYQFKRRVPFPPHRAQPAWESKAAGRRGTQ